MCWHTNPSRRFHYWRTTTGLVAGLDITLNISQNHDLSRRDVGMHLPIGAYGQAVLVEFDGSYHVAVNVKVFFAANLAVNLHGLPDAGLAARTVRLRGFKGMLDKGVASFFIGSIGFDGEAAACRGPGVGAPSWLRLLKIL